MKYKPECAYCRGDLKDPWFYIALDDRGVTTVISNTHKADFSEYEKAYIGQLFPTATIKWEMRKGEEHAHCHVYY